MKKKEKLGKYEKGIIIGGIVVLIIFLILLTADGIKNIGKNNNNLALSEQEEKITNTPNAPVLSAGMIPVKYNGDDVIICKNDSSWYSYENGNLAYMMLNDGTYQSELTVDMVTDDNLASKNIGKTVTPEDQGTIYMWIPRFAQKENGEIGYIKEETEPGGEWKVPETFTYIVEDETKPNFSLSGIWIEKEPLANIDAVNTKITNMNKENNIYGFIANTVGIAMTEKDRTVIENFSGRAVLAPTEQENQDNTVGAGIALPDWANSNRTILKIINTNKQEPIKANITQNTVANTIEIRVTYTKNGIKEILDENGNKLTLKEENGVILADTGERVLGKGTYTFTVVDNKGNKQNLSITPAIDSFYKVAYINGLDNMENMATYNMATNTPTSAETDLINQLSTTDTTRTYSRAIQGDNRNITAIGEKDRNDYDEQMYFYHKYITKYKYILTLLEYVTDRYDDDIYGYAYASEPDEEGNVILTGQASLKKSGDVIYVRGWWPLEKAPSTKCIVDPSVFFCKFEYSGYDKYGRTHFIRYQYKASPSDEATKGSYIEKIIAKDGTYVSGESNPDSYWYEKGELSPKYTLYKYDQDLTLQSTYDVDTKTLTTAPIDISNRENNKLKLTLTATGTDYKTYISSDNANWTEVTDITSGVAKELNVDGFNNLYIKIETNTSAINSIDIAYYKN